MANGPPLVDVKQANTSHEFRAPQTFTPFSNEMLKKAQTTMTKPPEGGAQTFTETPKFSEWNEADIQRFMADLEKQGKLSKTNEKNNVGVSKDKQQDSLAENMFKNAGVDVKVSPEIPKVKKSEGFWAQLIDWFKTTFRNLFR